MCRYTQYMTHNTVAMTIIVAQMITGKYLLYLEGITYLFPELHFEKHLGAQAPNLHR